MPKKVAFPLGATFVVFIVAMLATSSAGKDIYFHENAAIAVSTVAISGNPQAACSQPIAATPTSGWYATCTAHRGGKVTSVTMKFYPTLASAKAGTGPLIGEATLNFIDGRPQEAVYKREGGGWFD